MPAKKFRTAIAYTRVSTEKQGQSGYGLEAQRIAIKEFARTERFEIAEWYQDVGSGWGEGNDRKRPGFMEAQAHAIQANIPIIVWQACRVSRSSNTIFELVGEDGIEIVSASQGSLLSPGTRASSAARAEYERKVISETTKKALQEKKRQGVKLGNRTNLREAQLKGAAANKVRAAMLIDKIADVLEQVETDGRLTDLEIVTILNTRAILSGRGRPWTTSGIRRPLYAARQVVKERSKQLNRANPLFGRFG